MSNIAKITSNSLKYIYLTPVQHMPAVFSGLEVFLVFIKISKDS